MGKDHKPGRRVAPAAAAEAWDEYRYFSTDAVPASDKLGEEIKAALFMRFVGVLGASLAPGTVPTPEVAAYVGARATQLAYHCFLAAGLCPSAQDQARVFVNVLAARAGLPQPPNPDAPPKAGPVATEEVTLTALDSAEGPDGAKMDG